MRNGMTEDPPSGRLGESGPAQGLCLMKPTFLWNCQAGSKLGP